jgi:hypothetical protein
MGWYGDACTRKQKIDDLLKGNNRNWPIKHCYRGNAFSGILWSVWTCDDSLAFTGLTNWIKCDKLEYKNGMWYHKPMEESMGPYYYSCPLSYLDLAPVASQNWRDGVIQYHARRGSKRAISKLRVNQ